MTRLREAQLFRLKDFSKGMTSSRPITNMPANYSSLMQNCHITANGTVAKIPGYEKMHSTAAPVPLTNGYEFVKSDGTTEVVFSGGGKLFSFIPDTGQAQPTEIYTGMDVSAKCWFATINDLLVIVNGVDAPLKYDGTTVATLLGTPPVGSHVHTHYNRLWMTDVTNKMIVNYSALNDPENWTSPNNAGFIDLSFVLTRADEVLEINSYINHIVFFCRYHIIIYSGTNPTPEGDFFLKQNIKNVGVITTGSTYEIGADLLFVTDTGVRTLSEATVTGSFEINTPSEEVSSAITSDIATAEGDVGIMHYPPLDWIMVITGEKIWIYNYALKAWGISTGMDISTGVKYRANRLILLGDDGFAYEYGSGWSFGGQPVPVIWEGPFVFPKPNGSVQPTMAEIWGYGYEIDINFRLRLDNSHVQNENRFTLRDYPSVNMDEDFQDSWSNVLIMDSPDYDPIRIPLFGSGRVLQWSLINTGTDGPIDFLQIVLQAKYGSL